MGFPDAEVSITLTGDAEIAALAGGFGRAPHPTDVLAFALHDGEGGERAGVLLGDVVISLERAEAQARERRIALDAELRTLLVHGLLHLLGMDHRTPAQGRAMRELEDHLRWELTRRA